ncbi:MAG: hypothetical protein R3C19_23165 [Planctomycetaceae bacterium]
MRRFISLPVWTLLVCALALAGCCMSGPGYYGPGYYGPGYYGPPVGSTGNGYPVFWGPGPIPVVPVNGPGGEPPIVGYIPPGTLPPTLPSSPVVPISNPVEPTSPVSPAPDTPAEPPVIVGSPTKPETPTTPADPGEYWAPWPLPPRSGTAARSVGQTTAGSLAAQSTGRRHGHPMRSTVRGGSRAARDHHSSAGLPGRMPTYTERVTGAPSTPSEDLRYRGGRIIPHLSFVNLYVGGDDAWQKSDIDSIDHAIAAAMSDRYLNNVMRQYFNNAEITSTELPSHPLVGYVPSVMTQGDVEYCMSYLYDRGYLSQYDLSSTVFNLLLPPGTVLNDAPERRSTAARAGRSARATRSAANVIVASAEDVESSPVIPKAEEGDSTSGLGGYHGSIHKGGSTVYYSVDVYSERRADGSMNGIPVFQESWKNVVATLYHELNEARTDPDVEDAIRNPYDIGSERYLGWTSDRGEECGDYPLDEARQLSMVVLEVPLADGSGTVPVQLQYSNAVHGPEGPIAEPHPLPR